MRYFYWFLSLALCSTTPFSDLTEIETNQIPLIVDFIKSQNSPGTVLEHLCWNKESKFRLHKALLASTNVSFLHLDQLDINGNRLGNRLLHKKFFSVTVIADLSCHFDKIFDLAIKTDLLVFPNVWMVFGNASQLQHFNYYIPINCVFILPKYNPRTKKWQLIAFYKTYRRLKTYLYNDFGTWSLESGLNMTGPIMLARNRSDFMMTPLRISYVLTQRSSFEHLYDSREKDKDNWTKMNLVILQHICDFYNASHIKMYRSDWGFKSIHPTKLFTKGLFGDLLNDRADVGGTGSFMRLEHFKYFFAPVQKFSISFIFKAPPLAFYSNLFTLPFHRNVWVVVGLLVALGGIIIRIVFIWEETEDMFVREAQQNEENYPKILDVVMMQLAIICQMDFFYEPKSVSGKLAMFVVLISSTFIYTAYSARIVLLLQSTTTSIKDMGDLYRARYEFGADDHSFNRYYFRGLSNRTNEYWRKMIYENKMKTATGQENFFPISEGIRRVRDSYFAFHVVQDAAYSLIQEMFTDVDKCAVSSVETIFKSDVPYLSVPKNSSYFEFLVVGVRRLAESGIHNREVRRCYTNRPSCHGTGNSFVSVGIIECYLAFLIFGIGFALSLLIFVVELLLARYPEFRNPLNNRDKVKFFSKK